ncbi:hypothetical protein RvY_10778 [Ramazzottius varieornatus]|uniref:Uncharacterized protein n=1 Tax=Ramazzottius varieornatus TaxID=947166 RepID=A0A1D1VJA5_RAMVA|nr:hypothetical protein RvY_10778 [Ramazzottius varieornatus]
MQVRFDCEWARGGGRDYFHDEHLDLHLKRLDNPWTEQSYHSGWKPDLVAEDDPDQNENSEKEVDEEEGIAYCT